MRAAVKSTGKRTRKPITAPLPEGIATMPQAMAFLSKSRSTVERWIEEGKIQGKVVNRYWQIDARSLYEYRDRIFPKRSAS